jgi:hypothetical protein
LRQEQPESSVDASIILQEQDPKVNTSSLEQPPAHDTEEFNAPSISTQQQDSEDLNPSVALEQEQETKKLDPPAALEQEQDIEELAMPNESGPLDVFSHELLEKVRIFHFLTSYCANMALI